MTKNPFHCWHVFFHTPCLTKSEYGVYYVHTVCINNPLSYIQKKYPEFVWFESFICVISLTLCVAAKWVESVNMMRKEYRDGIFRRRVHEFISCVNCRSRNVVSKCFHTRFSVRFVRVLDGLVRLQFPAQDSQYKIYTNLGILLSISLCNGPNVANK